MAFLLLPETRRIIGVLAAIDSRRPKEEEDLRIPKKGSNDGHFTHLVHQSTMEEEEGRGSPPPEETG